MGRRRAARGALVAFGHDSLRWGLFTFSTLHITLWLGVVIGIVARRAWARALVLGTTASSLATMLGHAVVALRDSTVENFSADHTASRLAILAATCVLVFPLRRRELPARGVALALLVPGYFGALDALVPRRRAARSSPIRSARSRLPSSPSRSSGL